MDNPPGMDKHKRRYKLLNSDMLFDSWRVRRSNLRFRAHKLNWKELCIPSDYVYSEYIEDITRWREDMNFIFEWQNNILRASAASE